jgi:DNA-binding phage protein
MKTPTPAAIRSAIRGVVAEQHRTLTEVGERAGLTRDQMTRRMSGRTGLTLSDLCAIASALGVPLSTITERAEKLAA